MKAVVYHEYGPADVLKCEDVPKPVPKENEVLIKVRAASINPLDWRLMKGQPRFVRVIGRLLRMTGRMGVDVAGEVEAIGPNVKAFKPGDRVFGSCRGAFADYACAAESKVAPIPDNVTFEQAASVNVAGLTALQGLRDKARIQRGEKVLINGAAGGVGTFAVQIAKTFGAEVTGVCSTRNVEMVKSIGAHAVVDYTKEDFTKLPKCYDVIFDCVGNKSQSECRRVMNPKGRLIIVGGPHDPKLVDLLAPLIKAVVLSPFMSRKVIPFIAKASKEDLSFIGELIATGKLTPVIDRCYNLSEAADAVRYVEEGHARGKVLLMPA
jgi:NADPH:quinone reductase-like Zn-dependent oxidoreductase